MLSVTVNGDDALHFGQVFQHVGKGCFQRSALPFVDTVVQHHTLRVFLGSIKPFLMCRITAVIHNDNL